MKNNRFWNWVRNEETGASEMYLYGAYPVPETIILHGSFPPFHFSLQMHLHQQVW